MMKVLSIWRRNLYGRMGLPRDAADDAAVKHDVFPGPAGGPHLLDNGVGLAGDVPFIEFERVGTVRTKDAVHALPVPPEAEDVPGKGVARPQKDIR